VEAWGVGWGVAGAHNTTRTRAPSLDTCITTAHSITDHAHPLLLTRAPTQALAAHLAGASRGGTPTAGALPAFAHHSAPTSGSVGGGLGGGLSLGRGAGALGARSASAQLPVTAGLLRHHQQPQQQQLLLQDEHTGGLHHLRTLHHHQHHHQHAPQHAPQHQHQRSQVTGDDEAQQLAQLLLSSGLPMLQGPHCEGDEWVAGDDGGVHPGSATTGAVGALGRQATWPWPQAQQQVQQVQQVQQAQQQQAQQQPGGNDGLAALLHFHSARTSQQHAPLLAVALQRHAASARLADPTTGAGAPFTTCLEDDHHWRSATDNACAVAHGAQGAADEPRFARHSAPSGGGVGPADCVRSHSDTGMGMGGWRHAVAPPLRPLDAVDEELGSSYGGNGSGSGSGGGNSLRDSGGGNGNSNLAHLPLPCARLVASAPLPLPGSGNMVAAGACPCPFQAAAMAAGAMQVGDCANGANGVGSGRMVAAGACTFQAAAMAAGVMEVGMGAAADGCFNGVGGVSNTGGMQRRVSNTGGMDWQVPSPRGGIVSGGGGGGGDGGGAPLAPWLMMEDDEGLADGFGGNE
jgi:hypothetical protein